jgi:hypothetical protein
VKRKSRASSSIKKGQGIAFVPDANQRLIVSVLIECGIPHETIRKHRLINVCLTTFRRAFAKEIREASPTANQEIILSAYQQAKSGKVPAMTMFWLKCRCGWREVREPTEKTPPIFEVKILSPEESKSPEKPTDDPEA